MKPNLVKLPAMKFVGYKEKFSPTSGDFSGIKKAWDQLFNLEDGTIENEIKNDEFWGVTFDLDKPDYSYLACGMVSEFSDIDPTLSVFQFDEQNFLKFEHKGNVLNLGATIHKAYVWIEESSYTINGQFHLEMYNSRCNPHEPDSYVVDLYFPVQSNT